MSSKRNKRRGKARDKSSGNIVDGSNLRNIPKQKNQRRKETSKKKKGKK